MSVREIEVAVQLLQTSDLESFARWFEEYLADAWDRRIECDIAAGRLEAAGREADVQFETGRCTPV